MFIAILPSQTNPNSTYGMPFIAEVGGNRVQKQPQYIRGMSLICEGPRDFSVPYIEDDTDWSLEEDIAP